jgi:starvation-inducible DNA-binding protein
MASSFTVPGLTQKAAKQVTDGLQDRLNSLIDLALTLKHVHWNVVGPNFIGVHEMLDPQVDAVRLMVDETAERIATLGASPIGTPGHLVQTRSWEDYKLGRDLVNTHLAELNVVYDGIITDHRDALERFEEIDPVTHDMLIAQTAKLEMFQWFVRAHLENAEGKIDR